MMVGGGTQVTNELAVTAGLDAGFGRRHQGVTVASLLARKRRELWKEGRGKSQRQGERLGA
jgi:D-ornithine 4,5-aminomutase subunit beta